MSKKRLLTFSLILVVIIAILLCLAGSFVEKKLYPCKYDSIVFQMAEEYELAPSLVFAVIHTESKFEKDAVSSANAKGLMQITDSTFRWAQRREGVKRINSEKLFEPETNIKYGCYILVLLSEQFSDTKTILAAYNAGQGRVAEWLKNSDYSSDGITLETIPYKETANYVRRVLNTQKRYQRLYKIP